MVNLTFTAADQAEGRAVLAKMYPAAAEFLAKLSIEAGSAVVLDDEIGGAAVRVRISALADPAPGHAPT